jgi:ATP-binding cassette subfamily B protein
MDLAFFERSDSLNKLFRASIESGSGAFGPIQSVFTVASGSVQIVSLFGIMAYLQPLLAAVLLIAAFPLLIIRSLSAKEKYNLGVRTTQRRRLGRYFTSLLSDAENVSITRIFGLADEMIERFEKIARSVILEKKEILEKISYRLGISVIFYLAVLVFVVVWLSYRFSLGELEAGAMVAFILAALRSLRSIGQVSKALASGADSALAIIPLLEFLKEKPQIIDRGGCNPESIRGDIVFEDVSFIYPGTDKNVINNFSASIKAGEKVAIVGNNGAGKTTLTRLIARFYEINSGQIRIDDVEIRDLSLRWLHDRIAMVFQKPNQFEATVHDNIAFGDWKRLRHRPQEVRELAAKVGLADFIEHLPDGFDTHLGKLFGDVTLSHGQWQLLAVTRALAREDAILILDEPTSNMDIHAEAAIFRAIRTYAKNRTVLFVSHRFSTVKEADRILVLDEGRLVEDGTHEQLMKNSGYYAAMVRHQRDDEKI